MDKHQESWNYSRWLNLFVVLLIPIISSANTNVLFSHLDQHNGLIRNNVRSIQIDREGFVWFGTSVGLQRFDGYEFKDFIADAEDSTSISDNFIVSLFEDDSANLWVATSVSGLNLLNREQESFRIFRHDPNNENTLACERIPLDPKVITQDSEGYIWINTDLYLCRIDLGDFSIESFHGDFSGQLVFDKSISAIWIAGDKLKKFDLKSHRLRYYDTGPIHSIILDRHNNLWLGTESGPLIFNKNQLIPLQEYLRNEGYVDWNREILTSKAVDNFYEDYLGNIWFSIKDRLVHLNRELKGTLMIDHETGNENSPKGSKITGIYGDKSGVLWISYLADGVSKVNINPKKFSLYNKNPGDSNSLSGNAVRSIHMDKNRYLWIGTVDNGLNRITPGTERINHFRADPEDPVSVVLNYITALFVDKTDRLWVGSFNNGVGYADDIYSSGQLKLHTPSSLKDVGIHEFTEDPEGRLWISTNQGFYIYDPKNNLFTHYGSLENQLPEVKDLDIQSVLFQPPNLFWMATWNSGVCRLFIHSDSLMSPQVGKDSIIIQDDLTDRLNTLLDHRFITIHRSDNGQIWLGSYMNGLIRVFEEPGGLEFMKYDILSGAPDNTVYGIASDSMGNIWISSNKGIGRFDPGEEEFQNYDISDGLQSNSFFWGSSYESMDGRLFFGGTHGLNAFYPQEIVDQRNPPKIFISKLILNNIEVGIGEVFSGKIILNKDIRYTEEINLTRRESVFSIGFIAMDQTNPMEVSYQYKLAGFEENWIEVTAEERSVRYTNLDPGKYIFQVKASNSDGVWNEVPATLNITILSPWWRRWWAMILYSGIFAWLLITFRKIGLVRAQLINEAKMEHLEREKAEEMHQMKLRFFTNISHEFKTPLTLILSPLQKIIASLESDHRFTRQIISIKRNSTRLFRLIDQVMEFRKIDTNKVELHATYGDIVSFIRELVESFQEIARSHDITLDFQSDMKNYNIWFDQSKVDKIIYNLLSNAFKFTPDQGYIKTTITSSTSEPDKWLEISIEDNGIGMADSVLEHIFDRFYQGEHADSFTKTGSGIGLSLAKELTELHKGEIKVSSKSGEGTKFTVLLPHGKEHLAEEEMENRIDEDEGSVFSLKQFALTDEQKFIAEHDPEQLLPDPGKLPLLLVVDDDQELRSYIKSNLRDDYAVIEAENGEIGFTMALKNNPDIIISDIIMPVMDGIELCRKLKSDIKTSHIPVIHLTAKADIESRIEGLDTGADAYISKPFTISLIEVQIKNILKTREKLRKKFSRELILQPGDISITPLDEQFLQKAIQTVENHMADTEFSVDYFNREMGLSRSRMHRKLKALTAQSTSEFIRTIRMRRAASLLEKSQMSIEETAYAVGFNSTAYFTKCFKALFNETPSDYMKSHKDL